MKVLREEFRSDCAQNPCQIVLTNTVALVTVVGQHLRDLPHIATQASGALGRAELQVIASSEGASDCNISFVVRRDDVRKVIDVLHKEFHLESAVQPRLTDAPAAFTRV